MTRPTHVQIIIVHKSTSSDIPIGVWVRDNVPFTDRELLNITYNKITYTMDDDMVRACGQPIDVTWVDVLNYLTSMMIYKTDERTWKYLVGLVVVNHAVLLNLEV